MKKKDKLYGFIHENDFRNEDFADWMKKIEKLSEEYFFDVECIQLRQVGRSLADITFRLEF